MTTSSSHARSRKSIGRRAARPSTFLSAHTAHSYIGTGESLSVLLTDSKYLLPANLAAAACRALALHTRPSHARVPRALIMLVAEDADYAGDRCSDRALTMHHPRTVHTQRSAALSFTHTCAIGRSAAVKSRATTRTRLIYTHTLRGETAYYMRLLSSNGSRGRVGARV